MCLSRACYILVPNQRACWYPKYVCLYIARLSYPPTIIFSRALQLFSNIYYPKGNFEGNQLQDSSISLSPQHTNSRNKLQLRKTTNLHQNFLRLQTSSRVAHDLSGPNMHAFTNKLRKKIIVTRRLSLGNLMLTTASLYHFIFWIHNLHIQLTP